MDKVILTPVPLDELLATFRQIVKEEIAADQKKVEERLLSAKDACKIFQPAVASNTLTAWADQGLIPQHRIGGRVYYKLTEILASAKTYKKFKRLSLLQA